MPKILVVDDDKITHAFVRRALLTKFDIASAYSGNQALAEIKQLQPDIILLDVEMPGLNGYEVCEQLRSNPETENLPVIFLSARGELRDRMQGFEAGADDYIIKPFHVDELSAKINVLLQYRLQRVELTKQIDEARRTAFIAISSTSELGQAINFIERTHTLNKFDQLAAAFFVVTQSMDLKCTIMIKTDDRNLFFSSSYNAVSPMESDLIENLSTKTRFFDFGSRTQINFPNASLLIKNMPLDDMERYGRIKDFFPAMLSTMDIKITQIRSQMAVISQMEENRNAFVSIINYLEQIKSQLDGNYKQGVNIMRSMLMELDKKLPNMGLMEDQEQYILDRIDLAIEQAHKAVSENKNISAAFKIVLQNINELLSKEEYLQNQFLVANALESKNEDHDGYQMDVELF